MKLTRLREVRELRGWSQSKLAEESDVSRDGISNYETGHREAWPSTAKKLADALDVEISDLVARAEELVPLAEAPREAGPSLLDKALDAARQDEEKEAKAANRLFASEGELPATNITEFKEAKFRAELRARGFPDEDVEGFIWPLVTTVNQQQQEIARLREENSRLREEVEQESVHR